MSDNSNRRPRRRAARSAGPPVGDVRGVEVAVDESSTAATELVKSDVTVKGEVAAVGHAKDDVTAAAGPAKDDVAAASQPAKDDGPAAVGLAKDADATVVELTESEDADEESDDLDEEDEKLTKLGQIIGLAAAAVLVLALVVGATFTALAARSAGQDEDLRAQYTQTARQAVINLTTIRADSAKEDIDRILSVASGEFKTEFDGRVDPFMDVVKQAKVVSSGEVVESGIESVDENSAKVLVAAKQMVSNTGSAEPQARQYRFRITVSKGDAGMTVSKVEFVG
ncbi:hypothetical protein [Nocardia sp. NPDC058666]|uniref:hypothetical protein n=1 Tax=Nocardia sp. NPDC058666 TaxID=3346587 RepID=UPI00364DA9F4